MRIVFFGTPDFAVPSLNAIINSNHKVVAVVTVPDAEKGRGRKLTFSPIKNSAIENNIHVLQPESLSDADFLRSLEIIGGDLFVVVAFRILPEVVYTMPKRGTFNLHGSLLPAYRGAAPIQRAIMNGEMQTGLTTFFLENKVDTGNIILREPIIIDPDDNFGTLHDKMSIAGAGLVLRTIGLIETGNLIPTRQDDSKATKAPKISKEDCQILWDDDIVTIHNKVRGLSPYPGAFFIENRKIYKVYRTAIAESRNIAQGNILTNRDGIYAGCRNGVIQILEIQPEGRKRMNWEEFLRGYSI
ncbi:MAG: methionyl-tRNA formyltransferase [Ignavibacteriales bacterium]|nr:methionyl-tRNA formyltransferase [Ignavibacteriales bacterium]